MICPYCNKKELLKRKNPKTCGDKVCQKKQDNERRYAYFKIYCKTEKYKKWHSEYTKAEKRKIKRRAYRKTKKCREADRAYMKIRYKTPEFKKRINEYRRNRRKKTGSGYRKKSIWDALYIRQKGQDPICGKKLPTWKNKTPDFHIDHIFPASLMTPKQRNKDLSNLQILCKTCNISKNNKPFYITKSGQTRLSI